MNRTRAQILAALVATLLLVPPAALDAAEPASTHPATNPASPLMLAGAWVPEDSQRIDFDKLPRVASQHVVLSDVRTPGSLLSALDHKNGGVNQHNYLVHHNGKFWAMWSDGPGIEDRAGQRVKFASSADALTWSTPAYLTPIPPGSGPDSVHYNRRSAEGFRYIARGFWQRNGELLALAALDEAAEFFGKSLELRAFRLKADESWEDAGVVFKDAINNFPPRQLHSGDWMMSRRKHDYRKTGVHFLVGGVKALDQWESFPVLSSNSKLRAEEPEWWVLPDRNLVAIFRDNNRSGFLHRAFSTDDGRTWSPPVKSNFPDATSKFSGLRLNDGRYVLVSNPKPRKRDPLTLSISDDGLVFAKMIYLVGGRWVDYPHIIEHDGHLFIAFAGGKQSVEVLKVKLADLDAVKMPTTALIKQDAATSHEESLAPADVGQYFPFLQKRAEQQRGSLSYLAKNWPNADEWRRQGREKMRALLAYDPPACPLSSEVVETVQKDGYRRLLIRFAITAERKTEAFLLIPDNIKGKSAAILALHDHGGFYYFGKEKVTATDNQPESLKQFIETAYGGRTFADELARRGFVVLVPDAFYFGSQRIDPAKVSKHYSHVLDGLTPGTDEFVRAFNKFAGSHETLVAKTIFTSGTTWPGILFHGDRVAMDYLLSRGEVDPQRVGCMGLSIGGFRAAHLTGLDPRVKAAVVAGWMTTYESLLRDHLRSHTWMIYVPGQLPYLDLPDVASLNAPTPLMIANCSQDALFPLSGMQQAEAQLRAVYTKLHHPDRFECRYYDLPHSLTIPMQNDAIDWLERWLKPEKGRQ